MSWRVLKEYTRDLLFTRAMGLKRKIANTILQRASTDPVVLHGTMIITGFGSKVAPQLRPKVVDMVSQSGSSDNAGGTGPERVLSETSIAERASDQVAGDRLRACNYVNTQLRPSLKTLS